MTKIIGPKGWRQGQIEHRLMKTANATPLSYDAATHSCDAVLSKGSPVDRFFGREILRIAPSAVDVSRVLAGSAPLLDAHQGSSINHVLGRISKTWFADSALWGRLVFAETPNGQLAEGMVARGELSGISIGYRVDEWQVSDADGNIVDADENSYRWGDDLTFTATRWSLLEGSLAPIPADFMAGVRSGADDHSYAATRTRMLTRQQSTDGDRFEAALARMRARQAAMEKQAGDLDQWLAEDAEREEAN
jgi:phage head maturation protease